MNFRRSIIIVKLWRREFDFLHFSEKPALAGHFQNSVPKKFIATPFYVFCSNFVILGHEKSVMSCFIYRTKNSPGCPLSSSHYTARISCPKSARLCTQSAPDFIQISPLSGVISERVNTTAACSKVNSIFGWSLRFVFQDLPEPNRAWLLGVYVVASRPILSLYGIIYVTWYTRHLPKPTESDSGSFRYTKSRDYQTPTRHALLGHGKRTSSFKLNNNCEQF